MAMDWNENNVDDNSYMSKNKPANYIVKSQVFCPRNNAETSRPINLLKFGKNNKIAYKKVVYACNTLHNKNIPITTKNIITELNAEGLTDGNLQRKIMALMVCNGYLKKIIHKLEQNKIKYDYKFEGCNKVKCPYAKQGKCTFNWDNGRKEKYNVGEK